MSDEVETVPEPTIHEAVVVRLADLKPHPRNYRGHPEDQIDHLVQSIREHGVYRNVVVAEDMTILAGHGVTVAAERAGLTEIRVIRLPIAPDHPKALKILTGDNELGLRAEIDDRELSMLLKEIRDTDGLLGTGYDDEMLANLIYVTRPASEITGINAAEHWVGLPGADPVDSAKIQVVVTFETEQDRQRFMESISATVVQKRTLGTWSIRWPERAIEDLSSLRFDTPALPVAAEA